jgi:MYXO-CTERM domain-containing protein
VAVQAEGLVRYEPALKFGAGFQVKIFGISVVDWTILTIPMALPALERTIKLTGDAARLPLPVLEGIGDGARMDFATGTVQTLRVRNLGEGILSIEPKTAPGGALISRLDIPPGGEDDLQVFVADPAAFANGPLDVTLATNDPDRGDVKLQLGREVGGTDAGTPPDDGQPGGCSAGGGPAGLATMLAAVLGLVGIRRRRRYLA